MTNAASLISCNGLPGSTANDSAGAVRRGALAVECAIVSGDVQALVHTLDAAGAAALADRGREIALLLAGSPAAQLLGARAARSWIARARGVLHGLGVGPAGVRSLAHGDLVVAPEERRRIVRDRPLGGARLDAQIIYCAFCDVYTEPKHFEECATPEAHLARALREQVLPLHRGGLPNVFSDRRNRLRVA